MICVIITLLLFLLGIYGLLSMLIPELIRYHKYYHLPRYINNIEKMADESSEKLSDLEENSSMIFSAVTSKAETWLTDDLLPKINLLLQAFLPDSWGFWYS